MTDLEKLIEAVEAGAPSIHDVAVEALGPMLWKTVRDAYYGSLDAAKRLHDALLGPDWSVLIYLGAAFWDVDIIHCPYDDGKRRQDWSVTAGPEKDPARAWLLAILRALAAKGDA